MYFADPYTFHFVESHRMQCSLHGFALRVEYVLLNRYITVALIMILMFLLSNERDKCFMLLKSGALVLAPGRIVLPVACCPQVF